MNKFYLIIAAVVACAILMGVVACAEIYPTTFVVTNVDYQNDIVVLEDYNGHEWIWENAENWNPGDIAAAIMNDCNTRIIYDDEIIMLQYTGVLENW